MKRRYRGPFPPSNPENPLLVKVKESIKNKLREEDTESLLLLKEKYSSMDMDELEPKKKLIAALSKRAILSVLKERGRA